MINLIKVQYYRLLGFFKFKKYLKAGIIGDEFCCSPMYSNKLVHIYRNVNFKGQLSNIIIGSHCNISLNLQTINKGEIEMGNYVYMNSNCRFYIANKLKIGSYCMFGPNVVIWDSDNHPLNVEERHKQALIIPERKLNSFNVGGGDISIEDDVWIGMETLILGGVKIGKGSVIAARSVVTKDIPANVLAGGVPARIIKQI